MNAMSPISAASPTDAPVIECPRGLTIMDEAPDGCIAYAVSNDRAAPHVRSGDKAVIDLADRVPFEGRMYLVRWSKRHDLVELYRSSFIKSASEDEFLWFVKPLNSPRTWEEAQSWMKAGRAVPASDGPYTDSQIREKLTGRVVGVIPEGPPSLLDTTISSRSLILHKVPDDACLPHFIAGQHVAVDTANRELVDGGCYLVAAERPFVMQAKNTPKGWTLACPNYKALKRPVHGPYPAESVADLIGGRVVASYREIH